MEAIRPWLTAIELWCHEHDILLAVILALVFAVIVDALRFGSGIRTLFRIVRNKLAEFSEANLRLRIEEQEGVRQRIAAYLTSDKAIYMRAFRLLMQTLFLAVIGLALFLLANLGPYSNSELFRRIVMLQGIAAFGVSATSALEGMRLTSWDTREKVSKELAKRDQEIQAMRNALAKRGPKP